MNLSQQTTMIDATCIGMGNELFSPQPMEDIGGRGIFHPTLAEDSTVPSDGLLFEPFQLPPLRCLNRCRQPLLIQLLSQGQRDTTLLGHRSPRNEDTRPTTAARQTSSATGATTATTTAATNASPTYQTTATRPSTLVQLGSTNNRVNRLVDEIWVNHQQQLQLMAELQYALKEETTPHPEGSSEVLEQLRVLREREETKQQILQLLPQMLPQMPPPATAPAMKSDTDHDLPPDVAAVVKRILASSKAGMQQ
ncbi:expressed unknown protein [Seminavis robusta]|uniref:Uncharacterized protein n=1 Tax=Seminavis robusta TaxID=568900 RepID=A0A9N8HNS3_9STRA|nr:expressed unknown protein [Seminavis robusta]|eukprot:Sro1249_g255990.1 n/a (252) ;mRNA; r:13097-13852